MERIIVNPIVEKDHILSTDLSFKMEDSGIILVYDGKNIIGSVIYYEGTWIISLLDDQEEYSNIQTLLTDYPQFTFKYIT